MSETKSSIEEKLGQVFSNSENSEKTPIEEIIEKKKFVYNTKIDREYKKIKQLEEESKSLNKLSLVPTEETLEQIATEQQEYFDFAKKAKVFLHEGFNGKVPFFPRNLIFMAAKTGSGKTTIVSNVCYHTVLQGGKVLVITNEEVPGDFYSRIACLFKGWAYKNHDEMPPEYSQQITKMIKVLGKRITVIDDNYNGLKNLSTSIQGLERILERVRSKVDGEFDCVLIDYYQGFYKDLENPHAAKWEVQEKTAEILYQYKDLLNCPIVLLGQLKDSHEDNVPFKERIEGRKSVLNKATCAIEVIAEPENMRTSFTIRKARYSGTLGETIYSGFDRGKYVPYTKEFATKRLLEQERKERAKILGKVFDDEKRD